MVNYRYFLGFLVRAVMMSFCPTEGSVVSDRSHFFSFL